MPLLPVWLPDDATAPRGGPHRHRAVPRLDVPPAPRPAARGARAHRAPADGLPLRRRRAHGAVRAAADAATAAWWVVGALVITWGNDTSAYFVGRFLGQAQALPGGEPQQDLGGLLRRLGGRGGRPVHRSAGFFFPALHRGRLRGAGRGGRRPRPGRRPVRVHAQARLRREGLGQASSPGTAACWTASTRCSSTPRWCSSTCSSCAACWRSGVSCRQRAMRCPGRGAITCGAHVRTSGSSSSSSACW